VTGVTLADVRAVALPLPRTSEHLIGEYVKFRVGRLVYASVSPDEELMGFAFPKAEREALVGSDPAKFVMPVRSDERYNWVRVRLSQLDETELAELVIEAWRMCVPAKVSATVL
jgi:hypothetical protein